MLEVIKVVVKEQEETPEVTVEVVKAEEVKTAVVKEVPAMITQVVLVATTIKEDRVQLAWAVQATMASVDQVVKETARRVEAIMDKEETSAQEATVDKEEPQVEEA